MSVKILNFPKIHDPRGNLTFIQNPTHIPFEIKRIFWLQAKEQTIVGSAAITGQEVIVCLKGSFEVVVTHFNGSTEKFVLNSPHQGLYLPPLTWRQIQNFSTDTTSFHLTSLQDNESDQINDFETFKNKIKR
ncbi:MAG: WxcM-like domain-containing protein [Bacteroidia bacterium]|nr:WxcM-like domain-containing protein [Bacteroidia bacterium]